MNEAFIFLARAELWRVKFMSKSGFRENSCSLENKRIGISTLKDYKSLNVRNIL